MKKKIALIILNWNGKDDLLECLQSVKKLDQSRYDILPIVVDQGSVDGSIEAVKQNFSGVSLIENGKNVGPCEGYNIGMQYALASGADYLFYEDNDTVLDPQIFNVLTPKLEANPDIGIIGPAVLLYNPNDIIWCVGGFIDWKNFNHIHHLADQTYDQIPQSDVECDFLSACGFLASREATQKIGLWDKKFFLYHNDVEYCLRAKKLGYRMVATPQAKMWHKVSNTVKPYSPMMIYYKGRNKLFLLKMYGQNTSVLRFTFLHLGKAAKILRLKWGKESLFSMFKAFYHGLKDWGGQRTL